MSTCFIRKFYSDVCLCGSLFLYFSVTFGLVKFGLGALGFYKKNRHGVYLFCHCLRGGIATSGAESPKRQICILEKYLSALAEEPDLV